ncbi:hypothetical protein ACU4GD_12805 [Cupriavidus basilensis]
MPQWRPGARPACVTGCLATRTNKDDSSWHCSRSPNPACRRHPTKKRPERSASTSARPIRWWRRFATAFPEVLTDESGRALLPSVVRYLPNKGHADRLPRAGRSGARPQEHHRLGQALHGARPARRRAYRT